MFEFVQDYSLFGLFLSAFISSTLLPGGSEVALFYLATETDENIQLLWLVATAGNTLGGMTSWLLGRWLVNRFPKKALDEEKHKKAANHIHRWGAVALVMSWLPIVGDPLCFAAGWLKINFWKAIVFIALGKGLRYATLLFLI